MKMKKDLLQHDVHVTCDPTLIKCSRKTRRKNTILCYAQLSKSRQGKNRKKNSTVFVSKLGVDHGNILCTDPPPLKENPEGRGVCTQGIELRKKKPHWSEKFASLVSLIFLLKPKRSCGNTDSLTDQILKAKHNSFFSPSVTLFDLFGVILF